MMPCLTPKEENSGTDYGSGSGEAQPTHIGAQMEVKIRWNSWTGKNSILRSFFITMS